MKMYKTLIAATLGMWLAAPQAQTTAPRISDGVVKIGVITDMSGTYSDFGGPTAIIAAQMAIDDFGGKVLGKPIQIISADHQNKADVGSTKAREWYDTQGVDMITESLNSSVALSISKVSAEKKRLFMPIGPATTRLTNEDCNKYTIHYAFDTYALGKATINDMFTKAGHIREDGRMVHDMYLVEVKRPEESKTPWDYYKVLATIPAERAFQPLSASRCPLIKM